MNGMQQLSQGRVEECGSQNSKSSQLRSTPKTISEKTGSNRISSGVRRMNNTKMTAQGQNNSQIALHLDEKQMSIKPPSMKQLLSHHDHGHTVDESAHSSKDAAMSKFKSGQHSCQSESSMPMQNHLRTPANIITKHQAYNSNL
jgi:hypothetical protein